MFDKSNKLLLLIMLFFSISCLNACVYVPSKRAQSVLELNETIPKNCRLLGEVNGQSGYSFLAIGVEAAKSRAKVEAAILGATHVSWVNVEAGVTTHVFGRAYRCDDALY
ncbi:MAG: hypothetical protein ACKOAD_00085 [Gammaproteobacteria bacterium]